MIWKLVRAADMPLTMIEEERYEREVSARR